ncbi:glycosyltransferase [Sneathiella chinensis]|uniref:Glycosyl transferase family 28 C-terminal domain-containing protein n=1 Tax=Sneathiella chinensis TaxID=349750 RepID=A0ABQ5U925_9PROT|nr:glycosyltransferase [Sneathiella chinensis]GLQ07926.1 hypothetical protein GCM10007924_31480 [Sneathiella chinensis]
MIFLTVGHERSFDRLAHALDDWCRANPAIPAFGQLAALGPDGYRPTAYDWQEFLSPAEFTRHFEQASLVVAHAGMGTIITALSLSKPLVIVPRRGHLRETRNDHQMATARHFGRKPGLFVAEDDQALTATLDGIIARPPGGNMQKIGDFADPALIESLRHFIHAGRGR